MDRTKLLTTFLLSFCLQPASHAYAQVTLTDNGSTVTLTGEFTTAAGLAGNGAPGSTPGLVGPSPRTNRDKISPVDAGLDALTSVKSPE